MNEIIKKIEETQLKAEPPQFRVGDTVRVHAKIRYCAEEAEWQQPGDFHCEKDF